MKKIISIILLITLTLALSGCGATEEDKEPYAYITDCRAVGGTYDSVWGRCEDKGTPINYYTQAEVDEMFIKLYEDVDNAFTEVDEMEFGIRNDISSLREWNRELEQRIIELEEPIIYTECNMIQLLQDILVGGTQGYTFEIDQYGTMYELKDGVYTGDTFTNEDLLDYYCTIENGGE